MALLDIRSARETGDRLQDKVHWLPFLFVAFPYLSPIPLSSDVQPIAFAVTAFFLIAMFAAGNLKLMGTDKALLVCSVAFLVYIDPFQSIDFSVMKKSLAVLAGCIVYLYFKNTSWAGMPKWLMLVIIAYMIICGIQYVSPDAHQIIFGSLLARGGTFDNGGGRGITGPCQEPSFLAVNGSLFYLMGHRLHSLGCMSLNRLGVIFILCFSMALASFSGTGAILGVLMLAHYIYLKTRRMALPVLITLSIGLSVSLSQLTSTGVNVRSVALLSEAASDPIGLILTDASMAFRVSSIYAGVLSSEIFPFGTGRVNYDDEVISAFSQSSYSAMMPQISYDYCLAGLISGGTNDLGTSLVRMGILFVPIFFFVMSLATPSKNGCFPIVIIIVALSTSAPLSHPLIWCYLGFASGLSIPLPVKLVVPTSLKTTGDVHREEPSPKSVSIC